MTQYAKQTEKPNGTAPVVKQWPLNADGIEGRFDLG